MKLVIHIGYPKTATTTVQVGVLQQMHKNGAINYIGNAELMGDRRLQMVDDLCRKAFFRKDDGIGLYEVLGKAPGFLKGILSETLPNVLSNEYFLIPGLGDYPPESHPHMVRNAFGLTGVDISVLMTVRNHVSLIGSFFAHFYEWVHLHGIVANIERGVPDINLWVRKNILDCDGPVCAGFNFDHKDRLWAAEFGHENIHVNLFEDLGKNPELHFGPWAQACKLPVQYFLEAAAAAPPQRVRKQRKTHYQVSIPRGSERWARARAAAKQGHEIPKLSRLLWYLERRLPPRTVSIPPLERAVAEALQERYRHSNRSLLDRHGIPLDRAAALGYL